MMDQPREKDPPDFGGQPAAMPWDERPSIYEHVRAHVDVSKPGLRDGGYSLPDERRQQSTFQINFAPGALDGIGIFHMGTSDNEAVVQQTLALVLAYCRQPTALNKAALYQQIIEHRVVSMIDQVLRAIVGEAEINHQRLYELARSLATEAPDREPVKFGVAVLGLYGTAENEELFQTLGRHDEFTLFSAVALANTTNAANTSEASDAALWTLARNVEGWGRIHAVERLAKTERPEIKDWLLREGFRNSIMHDYLACTCARAGGLLAALSGDCVDRELLTAAGEIIAALIPPGPAEVIDDYEDAPAVVGLYVGHMETRAETLGDFHDIHAIKGFLDDKQADWAARLERGWTEERRAEMTRACAVILSRPEWPGRVREGLRSQSEVEFSLADTAARVLGIDTWDAHWRRLEAKPLDSGRWYHVMALCDDERIQSVIEAAEKHIDLAQIATGPSEEIGVGPGFEPHLCLTFVLQGLQRFPGRGARLIAAGLQSRSIQNRNVALAALAEWEQDAWPDGLGESLAAAADAEPDEKIRDEMQKVLKGEPLADE
jgi:hypothetical protein